MNTNKYLILIIFLFSIFYFLFSIPAEAAVLFFDPAAGVYQAGDIFYVAIRIDNEGECVNAAEINLKFPQDVLQAVDFNDGESMLSVWVKRPEIKNDEGKISFIGGIPGGYCGKISGDPGLSNALGKVIFRIPGFQVGKNLPNSAKIEFFDSKILLNDGSGTEAKLIIVPADFEIKRSNVSATSMDEWYNPVIKDDKIPPEPFAIELSKEASVQKGKYFIVFSATDKQSGIDRYEILESDPEGNSFVTRKKAVWKTASSPYFLDDQNLQSIIKVKAVDNAGNERVSEYVPERTYFVPKRISWYKWMVAGIAAILLLLALAGIYLLMRRRKLSQINADNNKKQSN